jgi:predicted lipoprotein with Yx(FWY)xxD motif
VGVTAASAAAPTVLVAANATFGPILTTGTGMALYTLNTDHDGQSTCHGSCAAVWPPLTVPAGTTPTAGPGVTGTVGSSPQTNGTFQVTYNGSPLYTFVSDSPGQVTGNNVTGFFVVTVAPASPTTTAPPGGGPTGTSPPTPGGTTPAPTPAATPTGVPSASAPASASGSGLTPAAPGSLAFTGAGPGLMLSLLLGLVLIVLGAFVIMITEPDRRNRHTES